jgi:hypothetical protein
MDQDKGMTLVIVLLIIAELVLLGRDGYPDKSVILSNLRQLFQ